MKVHDQAYVTLATNDSYALGALVLGHSLKESGTNRELAIIITPMVTQSMRNHLNAVYDHITCVDVLESQDDANLALIRRPELGVTFTKIKCWTLTQYHKCVYLDSDCLVLKNCDELFEHAEISAVPDIGWPDCFNSGMFVFVPSHKTYKQLLNLAMTQGSFDGGDQGLLNSYFSDWRTKDIKNHLSFIYNMASSATYTYLAAYRRYMNDIKIIHFLGPVKPWNCSFDAASGHVNISGCQDPYRAEHLQKWWNIYLKHLHGMLDPKFFLLSQLSSSPLIVIWNSMLSPGALFYPSNKSYNIYENNDKALRPHKPNSTKSPSQFDESQIGLSVSHSQQTNDVKFSPFTVCPNTVSLPNSYLTPPNSPFSEPLTTTTTLPSIDSNYGDKDFQLQRERAERNHIIDECIRKRDSFNLMLKFAGRTLDLTPYNTGEEHTRMFFAASPTLQPHDVFSFLDSLSKDNHLSKEKNYENQPKYNGTRDKNALLLNTYQTKITTTYDQLNPNIPYHKSKRKKQSDKKKQLTDIQRYMKRHKALDKHIKQYIPTMKHSTHSLGDFAITNDLAQQNSLLGTLPASQTFTASFVPPRKLSDKEHKDAWEGGRIDYLGADAFENIQKHIESQVHHINITNNKMFEKNSILPFDIPNNNLVSNDNSMNSLKNGAQSHSSCASTKGLGQNNVNLVGGGSRERGLYFNQEPDSNQNKGEDKIGFGEWNNNNLREFEEGTENSNFIAKKSAADVTPTPVIFTSSPNLSNKSSNDIAPKVLSQVYSELPKFTPSTCVLSPDTESNTTVDVRASSNDLGYIKSISTDTKEVGWLSYFGVSKIFNLIPIFKQHLMRMPTISMKHEMSDSKNRYISSLNTKTVTRSHSPLKDYGDIQVISYAENDKPETITTYHVPLIQPSVKVNEPTKAIALSVTVKNDNSTSSLKKTS